MFEKLFAAKLGGELMLRSYPDCITLSKTGDLEFDAEGARLLGQWLISQADTLGPYNKRKGD